MLVYLFCTLKDSFLHVMGLRIKYQKWNSALPAVWFAAEELGMAVMSGPESFLCVFCCPTCASALCSPHSHVSSTCLLQACRVNNLYWEGKPYLFSLNKGNAGCRSRMSAVLGFCQKYLSTVTWSTAKARRFSQQGAQKRCLVADKVADWFISNGFVSFLGMTFFQWTFLRCSVVNFIL